MKALYDIAIGGASLLMKVAALVHPKAKAMVQGRKGLIDQVRSRFKDVSQRTIWMHCASVGEFEQGRPVLEFLRTEFPQYKLVLTFFSPSGYELRKNYAGADHIFYLPWDTEKNAADFINIINPVLVIFVKYEFWLHYTAILHQRNIPLISISSIFREDQLFFRSYGAFYRQILHNFAHFFVQNDASLELLKSIGITNATKAGDTRFDRVKQIVSNPQEIPNAERFKAGQKLMVVGSCWSEDMEVLAPFINEQRLKFIIAPHEISEDFLSTIESMLVGTSIRYSKCEGKDLEDYQILLIDNVGLLSRLYRYGEFAFVGGAYGKGLHNILEAACNGVPVLFGNRNYEKFQEAVDLINRGGAFEIADYTDLKMKYEMLNVPENFLLACEVTKQYVEENLGATSIILEYCHKQIDL